MRALAVIRYPSGRFGFVGSVPANLALETDDASLTEVACLRGIAVAQQIAARRGRFIRERSFPSIEAALQTADDLGHGGLISNLSSPRSHELTSLGAAEAVFDQHCPHAS